MTHTRARADGGFTLVELMVTMTLLSIVAGMAYSSFTHAVDVYQQGAGRLSLAQSVRMGIGELTRDISNGLAGGDDEALALYIEDVASDIEGEGWDIITFVAHVPPAESSGELGPTSPLPPSLRQNSGLTEEEEDIGGVSSDLLRVAYMVGPDPMLPQESGPTESDEPATQSLLRVTTSTLELEEAFGDALGQDPSTMVAMLQEQGATVEAVIDGVRSLNFEFFDGEEWWDQWDVEEQGSPAVVRAALTVQDEDDAAVFYTRSSAARFMSSPGDTSTGDGGDGGGPGPQGPPGGP
ncbi:hypothetical protein CMK11_11055 [Candidatus Poribacteria bacterium]|nr:hypothetical protein [Candidatus Poribacteria bacterium]